MKSILFTEKNKAELVDEEIPQYGDNDILVKLAVSTISSGTERANLTGEVHVNAYLKNEPTIARFPRV